MTGVYGGPISELMLDYLLEKRVPGEEGRQIFVKFYTNEDD